MKCFKYTYRLLAALTLLMSFAGCTQDESFLSPDGQEVKEGQTKLLLSITMPAPETRATETTTLAGTSTENKLNRVTIFIADSQGGIQHYTHEGENLQTPLVYILANGGNNMQIFVAANMTDAQISAIEAAQDKNPALTISDINQITETNGFLMTAQATDGEGNNTINITPAEVTNIKANLNRVMSKVLLTCTSEKEGYAKLADGSKGYIKLKDVHYALETTNKRFFPFVKAANEDPNYLLSESLKNPGDFFAYQDDIKQSSNVAIEFDANRMNSSSQNPYTEGIYCLENTVDIDQDYGGDISIPKKVATYVKIAAKFTPMCIDSETELSEDQAIKKLKSNNGTFYVCKKAPEDYKHICYSSEAAGVEFFKGKGFSNITAEDFKPHKGGWQEYETFVASPTKFTAGSNLKRNTYYIINVTAINAPIQEKTIEVNTTVAGWTVKGKTTIEIETNNE